MIENIELLAFVRENLALARTIVVKNEDLAILDNSLMLRHYEIDSGTDKSKWRYYLNLNGEYHVTDEVMVVKSLDDNELIDFTKKNLEDHPATKKAYRLGGYYFSRLVAQYPHQMELIQGIINPIPPEESIPAKNYQILRYTKEYIEWNEFQLIPRLQDFINQTVYQSFNTEYKHTDDLLLPVLIGHLSEGIFKFLLECRFEHRFTRNAHSFYIWSYLQSKGISPIYKELLNNKQTMWLFRNIDYVLRNLGKSGTFKELIEILLSERNIPLAKYDLIQSTEKMSEQLHSEPLFFSERLNLIETRGLGQQTNKIARTMLKEVPESLDNEIYYDKYLPTTTAESTYGEQTTYPTKILDSELVDTTNRKPETIFNILNNELIYLAGNDLYNINLDIEDPLSGIHQRISVKDAIVLWHHLLNKYNGADCDKIPSFYYQGVLKIVPPTIEVMQSVGSKPFLNEEWCRDVLKTYIPQIKIVSPSIFYENTLAIFNLKWDHVKMYSRWLSIGYYSRRKNAISTMYETGFVKLTDKKTYSEFLEQYDFDFSSYRKEDYFSLMWEIWRKMTGWDQFSHITIGQIQDGMIGLMKFLSSYSVQYIHQTTMEDGWYEGGLDLMTENPGLLHPDGDGQLELESSVESNRIPVHHRVVVHAEEEETYYLDNRLDHGTLEGELEMLAKVYETPKLYHVELEDADPDDGFHGSQVMDFDHKLRLFTGKLPYELEDLIPEGGSRASDHTLKEMIVDSFDGIRQVGPWIAKSIWIVDNKGLDNKAIASNVDGFEYVKIMETTQITKDTVGYNRYYIGFVPELLDSNVIKLDVVAEHEETGELVHVRFDYNIQTKQNTWAISFEIPESVLLNTPFDITPTITGLSLGDETVVKENYIVASEISEFLRISDETGVPQGEFLETGWPEELPVMYVLQTSNGGDDELLSRHYYYMRGLIPSDRYYDPLLDPEFEPKGKYFEADLNAITLEHFSVSASNKGWVPVDLFIKKNDDGTYPTDLVKTDYVGITDYLTPCLSERKFFDKEVDGKAIRTFEWSYAVAKKDVEMTLILQLQNEAGDIVLREFKYKPTVVDHGIDPSFDILPEEGFKFGIGYTTNTALTVANLPDTVTLTGGVDPVVVPNQSGNIEVEYDPTATVEGNKINGYEIRPRTLLEEDMVWAAQVEGKVKAVNGTMLIIRPYSTITILKTDVVDYNAIDTDDIKLMGWENSPIYAHAVVPSRYAIADMANGWQVTHLEVIKTNNAWPAFFADSLPGVNTSTNVLGFDPIIRMGVEVDGSQKVPEGYDRWFTIFALANRDYLKGEYKELEIPIRAAITNKYTGKTSSILLNPKNGFSGMEFPGTRTPDEIVADKTNHIVPSWTLIPLETFGEDAELISNEGIFVGVEKYKGQNGLGAAPTTAWNADDSTADIVMPAPPLANGLGIRIYNKKVYRSKDSRFANSSVQDVAYYPYIAYDKSEIMRVPPPTLEELDFTNLDNVDFFEGVRSTYVTLYNASALSKYRWAVRSLNLEVYGTEDESDHIITKIDDLALDSYIYKTGTQANSVHDAPSGKNKYSSAYVGFVPAKTGKQKFGVIMVLQNQLVSGIEPRTYRYEIEIDVKEREGKVVYDKTYRDPWWLIGEETFVLTDLEDYTGNFNSKKMVIATISSKYNDYVSVRTVGSSKLGLTPTLAVTVPKRFTGVTPEAIVVEALTLNGYVTTDPRRTRHYFGLLPIQDDRLYTADEITLETIGFEPDVVFNEMRVNQSYTERYLYNNNSRGWYVNTVRTQDEPDWMNHHFEYKGETVKEYALFNVGQQNISRDGTVTAPEGKRFYLPLYGGRKTGKFPVTINILLSNDHHANATSIQLAYETMREIIESDIKLNLGYEGIYIGKDNIFTGGFEGVPSDDMHYGLVATEDKYAALGEKKSSFQLSKYPYKIKVSEDYEEGSGSGLALRTVRLYGEMGGGLTLETATWIRGYRGEQIINEEDITVKLEYPEISDFDITLLPSTMIQGVACTLGYMYNTKSAVTKGWTCSDQGLSVYGTDSQSEVMITNIRGKDLEGEYIYGYGTQDIVPSDAPANAKDYAYGYVTFMPAKAGKQTIEVDILIKHKSPNVAPVTMSFKLDIDVKANEGSITYDSKNSEPWFLVGYDVKLSTVLSGYTGTLTADSLRVATTTPESEGYLTVAPSYVSEGLNGWVMVVNATKDFEEKDRDVIVGHAVTVSGYDSNDKRSMRTYYDVISIDNTHVYSLDNLKPSLVDLQGEVVFDAMEMNTSYTERYSYLKTSSSGWVVESTKLIEEKDWMNHIFEYDGETTTTAQLFTGSKYGQRYDKNIAAPADRLFAMPTYGSRKEGEFEVTFEINIATSQFGKRMTGTISYKQKRKIVDVGIGASLKYDALYPGKKNPVELISNEIPRPDLKEGVIQSSTYYGKVGKNTKYFTFARGPYTLTIGADYPLGSGGVMLTFVYPYSARRAGSQANSETDNRAYRGSYIVSDEDIVISPEMFEVVPAQNELLTGAICTERFYVKPADDLAASGWKINSIGVKGMHDNTFDKSMFITEVEGLLPTDLYSEKPSTTTGWKIDGVTKDAFIVQFALKHFKGPLVNNREDRTLTIPMVIYATAGGKEFKIPFDYVTKPVVAGTDPTFRVSYGAANYWVVNDKEEKRTTLSVDNIVGGYKKRSLGFVRPYGDNKDKTTVSTVNQGNMTGSANTIFKFTAPSDTDFTYMVVTTHVIDTNDQELTTRRFFGTFVIGSDNVQDYENWDLSMFDFVIGQYKPMYANEYSVLELRSAGFIKGLGIGSIDNLTFSNDVVMDDITVDGVTQNNPLPSNFLLNVNADGSKRLTTTPNCYIFLGFTPRYASETTIKFRVTFRVGYSAYTVERDFEFKFKTYESRGHVGLIGDMYWSDATEKSYKVVPHRAPLPGRDNMTLVTKDVGFFSKEKNTGYWDGDDKITIFPAPTLLDKPLEIFVFYQYRDDNMVNKPARLHGILYRHRFYNNGYEWKLRKSTTGKTGSRTSVYNEFDLYKNGEKSQDKENGAVPPAVQVINGLSHAVSYGGGNVVDGAYSRAYLTSYIPECYFDLQAIGESIVAGNNAHIFTSGFDASYSQSKRLHCRAMYLNEAQNLILEFAYNAGAHVNDWNVLPDKCELTKQSWQIGGANNVAAAMADMKLVNMKVENIANVGIVTFEFEKPANVTKFAYNSLLTIDSVLTITLSDGSTVDLQIRVEKGRMAW